jgi:hypothetical protein
MFGFHKLIIDMLFVNTNNLAPEILTIQWFQNKTALFSKTTITILITFLQFMENIPSNRNV